MPSRFICFCDVARLTLTVPLGAFCGFFPSEVFATKSDSAGMDERSQPFSQRALTRAARVPSATHHRVVRTLPFSVFLPPGGYPQNRTPGTRVWMPEALYSERFPVLRFGRFVSNLFLISQLNQFSFQSRFQISLKSP